LVISWIWKIKGYYCLYRQVTTQEGEILAKEKNYIFQEVSAKSADNINTLFYQDIFNQIARKFNLIDGADEGGDEQNKPGIKLDEDVVGEPKKSKKKCC
jgi:hypothetical protein